VICLEKLVLDLCLIYVSYRTKLLFIASASKQRTEGSPGHSASLINLVWSGYSVTKRTWWEGNTACQCVLVGGGNLAGKGVVMVGVGGWPGQNPAGGHCTLLTRVTAIRVQPSVPEVRPDQHHLPLYPINKSLSSCFAREQYRFLRTYTLFNKLLKTRHVSCL